MREGEPAWSEGRTYHSSELLNGAEHDANQEGTDNVRLAELLPAGAREVDRLLDFGGLCLGSCECCDPAKIKRRVEFGGKNILRRGTQPQLWQGIGNAGAFLGRFVLRQLQGRAPSQHFEFEADDALGAAARIAGADQRVEQVLIVTADKDLGQCVEGDRIVQFDRRNRLVIDEAGVTEKFGVGPASIPDYLGLVGDSADGFPGLPGWGAKSSSAVLARYEHLENIPAAPGQWDVPGLRGAAKLAATLQAQFDDALLFRKIATLDYDVDVGNVDDWQWGGPTADFATICAERDNPELLAYAERLAR